MKPKQIKRFKPYATYTDEHGKEWIWCPPFDSKKTYKGAQTVIERMLKKLRKDNCLVTGAYIKEITEVFHDVLPIL